DSFTEIQNSNLPTIPGHRERHKGAGFNINKPMKEAILLLAHGTPDVLGEIGLRDEPLPEGPPLTRWTLRQAELLAAQTGRPVYVGMRNWHPFIADTVDRMKADGITHARVLCLAPQNSRTSTGLYRRALDNAVDGAFTCDFIAGWSHEPLLAAAFAERLQPVWAEACVALGTQVPVL